MNLLVIFTQWINVKLYLHIINEKLKKNQIFVEIKNL